MLHCLTLRPSPRLLYSLPLALALDAQSNLYVGGSFACLCTTDDCSGTILANDIAWWNKASSTWTTLGVGPNSAVNDFVYALAWWAPWNLLIVGGRFTTAGSVPVSRLALWDGSTWASLKSGVDNTVFAIALD